MPNADIGRGFKPVKTLDGKCYSGFVKRAFVDNGDSTAIFVGGPVKFAGSADSRGIPTMAAASSGDAVAGVMVGVDAATRDSALYRVASTDMYIFYIPVNGMLFEVQEDSDSNALTADSVGSNAGYTAETGSTVTGYSTIELDSTSAANTNTLPLQIVEMVDRDDNEIGDYAKWLVRFNDLQYANQIAGTSE
jgi:hypothetical protein